MEMLKRNLTVMAALIFAVFALQSCADKSSDSVPVTASDDVLLTSEFELEDLNGVEHPEFTEATEDREMMTRDRLRMNDRGTCAAIHHRTQLHQRNTLDHPNHLGLVFHRMNLDTNQVRQIRRYLRVYCECTSIHLQVINSAHREIIARGNNQRMELIQSYRNGNISRSELHRKLHSLNERMRMALQEAPGKREAIESIRRCRGHLFKNIGSLLNPQQLQMWRHWVGHHHR